MRKSIPSAADKKVQQNFRAAANDRNAEDEIVGIRKGKLLRRNELSGVAQQPPKTT